MWENLVALRVTEIYKRPDILTGKLVCDVDYNPVKST